MGWKKTRSTTTSTSTNVNQVYTTGVAANLHQRRPAGGFGSRKAMTSVVINFTICRNYGTTFVALHTLAVVEDSDQQLGQSREESAYMQNATRRTMTSSDSLATSVRLGQALGGIGGRTASLCTRTRACTTTRIVQTDGRQRDH